MGSGLLSKKKKGAVGFMVLKTGTVKEPEKEIIIGFKVRPGSD